MSTTGNVPTPHGMKDDHRSIHGRILRREMHSPRSTAAIVVAILLIVVFAWIAAELVTALLGYPALLVAPIDMFRSAMSVPALTGNSETIAVAAAIVSAILGVVLIVLALSSGRRARHTFDTERAVAVIDNEVIASALARHASLAAQIDPDNTTVSVSHRRATVRLTPVSGRRVDTADVTHAVRTQLDAYDLRPKLSAKVLVASNGKVGA